MLTSRHGDPVGARLRQFEAALIDERRLGARRSFFARAFSFSESLPRSATGAQPSTRTLIANFRFPYFADLRPCVTPEDRRRWLRPLHSTKIARIPLLEFLHVQPGNPEPPWLEARSRTACGSVRR